MLPDAVHLQVGAKTEEHLENRHALLWASLQFVAEHTSETGPKDLADFRHVRYAYLII